MKRILYLTACTLLLVFCRMLCDSALAEAAPRGLTVMVYMCGSTLESGYGSASTDIEEMVAAGINPKKTGLLVMAGGSDTNTRDFSKDSVRILEIGADRKRMLLAEKTMNMGEKDTLVWFIRYCMENRPAEKYALILWDHGGGPLEGVCWDETHDMDHLLLGELVGALDDVGLQEKLSWIGFDACLMGCAEVGYALSPYAEYMIASQEKEPASGWDYRFLSDLAGDADGAETGRRIIDLYLEQIKDGPNDLTLSCVDLNKLQTVLPALDAFFANVGSNITPDTYHKLAVQRLDSVGFGKAFRAVNSQAYDLVDLQDLVRKMGRNGNNAALLSQLREAVVYSRSTIPGATGLSVYHPFSNKKSYIEIWNSSYSALDFSTKYQRYVSDFGKILTSDILADWSGLQPETELSGNGQDQVVTLQLTEMQQKTFARGQLLILAAYDQENGIYTVSETRNDDTGVEYSPVSAFSARLDASGKLSAVLDKRTLYVTDDTGKPIAGPLAYELADDGKTCYLQAVYHDQSGREDAADSLPVLYSFEMGSAGVPVKLTGVMGYDPVTETYTPRVPVDEEEYTTLFFRRLGRIMPEDPDHMPGFYQWEMCSWGVTWSKSVELPLNWQLRFFDEQLSATQLYAVFQITDNQQSTHTSRPVSIANPNLEAVRIEPRVIENENYRMRFFLLRDTSPLDPGVNLVAEFTNLTEWTASFWATNTVINGTQGIICTNYSAPIGIYYIPAQAVRTDVIHLDGAMLANLESIDEISMTVSFSAQNGNNTQDEIRLKVERCDLAGIAQQKDTVLGRGEAKGLTWELVDLEKSYTNDLKALFRVTNHTPKPVYLDAKCAVNDLLIDDNAIVGGDHNYLSTVIPANAMGYISVPIADRCYLTNTFSSDGESVFFTLNEGNQMEQHGITEIRSLRLVPMSDSDTAYTMTLPLDTPIPMGGIVPENPEGKPLITGQLDARVERIYVADDGIGLRLVLSNPTDRDILVCQDKAVFNGRYISLYEGYDWEVIVVPSKGRTIQCVAVSNEELLKKGEAIESVSLFFRIDKVRTETVIRLFRDSGESRYVPEDRYEIIPGIYDPVTLRFTANRMEEDHHFAVQIEGSFSHFEAVSPDGDINTWADEPCTLMIRAKITNLSDEPRDFRSSPFVINGTRVTDVHWFDFEVQPGETVERTDYIPVSQLLGLTEIHEISCTISSEADSDADAPKRDPVPIAFPVEPEDLSPVIPALPDALAETEDEVKTVQLLELSENEKGCLTVQIRICCTEQELAPDYYPDVLVNGISLESEDFQHDDVPKLARGQDYILTWVSKNQAQIEQIDADVFRETDEQGTPLAFGLEDHLLERRGVHAVSEIRIAWGSARISLNLREPVPLADIPAVPDAERLRILEEPVEVLVNHVLVGEKNVYISIDMINRTESKERLYAESPMVNGEPCLFRYDKSDFSYNLPPQSRTTDYIMLKLNTQSDLMRPGDLVQDLSFVCHTDKHGLMEVTMNLLREAPLGVREGVLLEGTDLAVTVSKAELLLLEPRTVETEIVSPVQLIPALDREKAGAFVDGTATVFLRGEDTWWELVAGEGEDGFYEHMTAQEPICRTKLNRNMDGIIVSKYSGLACVNSIGQILMCEEYSDQDEETAYWYNSLDDEDKASYVLSFLYADIYLSRSDYRTYRVEHGQGSRPRPDSYLAATSVLKLANGHLDDFWDFRGIYNEYSTEISYTPQECKEMICVQHQTVMLPDIWEPRIETRQIANVGDLRYIRADEMEGMLVVCYNLTYEDGSKEIFYEDYPAGN